MLRPDMVKIIKYKMQDPKCHYCSNYWCCPYWASGIITTANCRRWP